MDNRFIKVACDTCGRLFYTDKYSRKRVRHSYCSKECNSTLRKKGQKPWNYIGKENFPETKCDYCGKKIKRNPAEIKYYEKHFCSRKCNGKWKAENLVGSLIYNWKGGYQPYYGPNWRRQRYLCRIRDKNTCQICGKSAKDIGKNIDVDHKIPQEAYIGDYIKANDLSNLWCLCPSHHTKKTNRQVKYGKMTPQQWEPFIKEWYG